LDTRVGERDAVPPGCRIASTTGTLRRLCRRVVVPPPPLGCRFPCAGRRPAGFGDGGGADHWGASTMGSAAASVGEERGVERMGTIVRVERKVWQGDYGGVRRLREVGQLIFNNCTFKGIFSHLYRTRALSAMVTHMTVKQGS
jgi:hypothetical protein